MTSTFNIDDFNTTLIQYSGSWEAMNSSSRQWDGTVHTTGQAGASATFQFRGFQLMVWGTTAAGVGSNSVQLTIDGGPPNVTSQTSNGSAVYDVVYFETPLLTETYHTAVVTNLGSTTNGSSEFELDRFSFETTDITPLFAPPTASTSQTSSESQTQLVPASATGTGSASSATSSSKSPLAAIAGSVIGALALVIIVLLFFLWRRKKKADGATASDGPTTPRPFPLNRPSQTDSTAISSTLTRPNNEDKSVLASNPQLLHLIDHASGSSGSNSQSPTGPITTSPSSTGNSTSSEALQRDGSSIRYLFTENALNGSPGPVIHPPPLSPSVVNSMYDNPPPSYWRNDSENDGQSGNRSSGMVTP